jgi:hypothetical protein
MVCRNQVYLGLSIKQGAQGAGRKVYKQEDIGLNTLRPVRDPAVLCGAPWALSLVHGHNLGKLKNGSIPLGLGFLLD